MLHGPIVLLPALAFLGAGLFNARGTRATREDFVRWGYPPWWCRVAGALEIAAAGLIALPAGRGFGLALGALVLAAAAATVLTRRAFGHLAPIGGFAALLLLAAAMA